MTSLFVFRRDLRLYDNTSLILADKNENKIIPIFIFDPYQIERKDKSNNCVQFMIESLVDLKKQLKQNRSNLHTFYGEPWNVIKMLIERWNITSVYMNVDYTKYSKYRDKKIYDVCIRKNVQLVMREDCMLNNVETITTSTGKHYEKFTPYYENAIKYKIRDSQRYIFKHLIKKDKTSDMFLKWNNLYTQNDNLYIRGGRDNGKKILRHIIKHMKYNETKNYPEHDTTLLSPHNKFGTVSIREVYHAIKNNLGRKSELLRQLYWRDFYYAIGYNGVNFYDMTVGKYAKMKWKNDKMLYNKFKNGNIGIPMIDAGIRQLTTTGWIHNRLRLNIGSTLTKILQMDWRIGENFFRKYLIDYDVTQNIMNWYWISSEVPFANPYFRILNPSVQSEKYDDECVYSKKWSKNDQCEIKPVVDISKMIKKSIIKYSHK